jgi:3-phytase
MRFRALIVPGMLIAAFAAEASEPATVTAVRETPPVGVAGDAADDPAIILGKTPADTRIVGTQKRGGLYVYDLDGKVVQELLSGRPNNVDARDQFPWADGAAPIVATSDRADNAIALYRFDPKTKQLDAKPRARIATGFAEVYGVALGRLGDTFVAVATSKTGEVGQWSLKASATGVKAARTRAFALGSVAEGCAVDDDAGLLYVAQEPVGLWRVALDPAQGDQTHLVDGVAPKGKLAADVEGVAIWRGDDAGGGYIIVSAQGESRFNVYDRAPPNRYRGTFRITDNKAAAVDGVSATDGLDAASANLGPQFPKGILVVQDDLNTLPSATQNFKYVSWADVEAALALTPPK